MKKLIRLNLVDNNLFWFRTLLRLFYRKIEVRIPTQNIIYSFKNFQKIYQNQLITGYSQLLTG